MPQPGSGAPPLPRGAHPEPGPPPAYDSRSGATPGPAAHGHPPPAWHAQAPPGWQLQPPEIRVHLSVRATWIAILKAFLVLATGLGIAGALGEAVNESPHAGAALRDSSLLLAVAIVLLSGWLTWLVIRPALARNCSLRLEPDRLVVKHPAIFRKPLEVPRADIAAVWFDPRPVRAIGGDRRRFHLGRGPGDAERDDVPEWLYSPAAGAPFPVLSHVADVPNVALVFTRPIEIGSVRGFRLFASLAPTPLPLGKTRARGLLVNVVDPRFAWEVLHGWAPVRPLATGDVLATAPGDPEARRARRAVRAATAGVLAVAAVDAVASALLAAGAPPSG